jgi:hypothetical protein
VAEVGAGFDNKSAVAFEKAHRVRLPWLRMAAGGMARLPRSDLFMRACPSSPPAPPTQLPENNCGAQPHPVPRFAFGAPGVGGVHRHGRAWGERPSASC